MSSDTAAGYHSRVDYLALADAELLAQCEVDTYRASGPGGQKRNKTSSAVRLRHQPTGVSAHATESRSQHENRVRALRRLRERLALELRTELELSNYDCPPELAALFSSRTSPGRRSVEYLQGLRALLDLFAAVNCSVREAAEHLGVTTGQLSKLVVGDELLLRTANTMRARCGLRPLR